MSSDSLFDLLCFYGRVAILVSAIPILIGRLLVPGHDLSWAGSYEAIAHIWCGAMIVLAFQRSKTALVVLAALTIFETVMFLTR